LVNKRIRHKRSS